MNVIVTAGGVLVGICILGYHLVEWCPPITRKKKSALPDLTVLLPHLGSLLPFLFGWAYGALGILTTMGLIGWGFDAVLWVSNWLGDATIWLGVGDAPGRTAAGAPIQLTALGNIAVMFLTVIVFAIIKFRPSGPAIKRGVWCGLCLGTSGHIAGAVAGPLAMGANWIGQNTFGAV